jgi:hypothetical protein
MTTQRPEREAMQRCYCGPRECLHPANLQPGYQCAVVLAALPPTPTPGLKAELRAVQREVAQLRAAIATSPNSFKAPCICGPLPAGDISSRCPIHGKDAR